MSTTVSFFKEMDILSWTDLKKTRNYCLMLDGRPRYESHKPT